MSGPRVSYLGPPGTFSDDALRAVAAGEDHEPVAESTILAALRAVADGRSQLALVPFENSTEGSVRPTLDALAFEVDGVRIVGEYDHPISQALIAAEPIGLEEIDEVASHPQAAAQCARFLRDRLPHARVVAAASTADAVRELADAPPGRAALGAASAAEIYGASILESGISDEAGNVTRFAWIAAGDRSPEGGGGWRTTFIFSELGADHPGALVEALVEFSSRGVNMTRIESRPSREGLGRYMFFCDVDGDADSGATASAIAALRSKAGSVRILGSYPTAVGGLPHTIGP